MEDVYNGLLDSDEYGFVFARSVSALLSLEVRTLTRSGRLVQTSLL